MLFMRSPHITGVKISSLQKTVVCACGQCALSQSFYSGWNARSLTLCRSLMRTWQQLQLIWCLLWVLADRKQQIHFFSLPSPLHLSDHDDMTVASKYLVRLHCQVRLALLFYGSQSSKKLPNWDENSINYWNILHLDSLLHSRSTLKQWF